MQLAAHRPNELLANGEPEAGARERVVARRLPLAEGFEEAAHDVIRNAPAGILHRKLDQRPVDLPRAHRDRTRVGELDRVRRQVEQDTVEGGRMAAPGSSFEGAFDASARLACSTL